MDGLRCIDDFTLRCLDREHRAYFNTLYAGTTQVIVDLCQEGTYQSGKQDNKLRDISMPFSCEVGMSRVNRLYIFDSELCSLSWAAFIWSM